MKSPLFYSIQSKKESKYGAFYIHLSNELKIPHPLDIFYYCCLINLLN